MIRRLTPFPERLRPPIPLTKNGLRSLGNSPIFCPLKLAYHFSNGAKTCGDERRRSQLAASGSLVRIQETNGKEKDS